MIPILYPGTEQSFLTNGLGRLADAISCIVTEERNGTFELEMEYPITGVHYSDIQENNIILAKTEDGGSNQAFIIYKISKPLDGIVTINAQHISYLLNGFPIMPFTATSCADAISKISTYSAVTNPFVFHTDINSDVDFELDAPRSIRNLLGGESGSLLDIYGGYDYKFDNFHVYFLENRGNDNGVSIRYGKNLTELKNVVDTTNVYTGILPYWEDAEGNSVYLPEKVVLSDHVSDYPYKIIKTVDFSAEYETAPTADVLRQRAQSYLNSSNAWKLKHNIDVSFISLAQTEEYKHIAALERVKLCDLVTVIYDKLGVNIKTKVIKTKYNVLTEKYDSISLGDTTYTLAQAIGEAINSPIMGELNANMKNAIEHATKLIQGGLGGHVVFNTDANGEPQEILIMDTDNISTAVNVIRMNMNGIGFSQNGYNGPFTTAWTIDGGFVADFITTGHLDGALITAGSLETGALSVDAQSELGGLQSLIPVDWTSASRWKNTSGAAVSTATVTVSGTSYPAITAPITNASNNLYVFATLAGQLKLNYSFRFQITRAVTLASATYLRVRYLYGSGAGTEAVENVMAIPAGSYAANTEYKFSGTYTLQHVANPYATGNIYSQSGIKAVFEFINTQNFYSGASATFKVYDLSIYSLTEDYRKGQLSFTNDGLNSVVQAGSVISSINQSAEAVTINASKIDLTGALSLHGNFTSYYNSNTYAYLNGAELIFYNSGKIVGKITPTYGNSGNVLGFQTYRSDGTDLIHISPEGTFLLDVIVDSSSDDNNFHCQCEANFDKGIYVGESIAHEQSEFHGTVQFYKAVYNSSGGQVFVSDKRKKRSIKDLAIEKARSFIMALKPREFKFIKAISQSDRKHHGFIAQELHEAMPEDWGVYIEDKKNDFIGLRYDEIIADLVKVVQDQEQRLQSLERKINDNSGI